jgi:ribosome-binding protein aMBF1 (putative translation factor)
MLHRNTEAQYAIRERVRDALARQRRQRGLSRADAARQIGIDLGCLARLESAASGPVHLDIFIAVLDWLGLELAVQAKSPARTGV